MCLVFLLLLLSVSSSLKLLWSWQLRTDKWVYTPGGQRQPNPQWMRSVCAVSFGSQRGLSSSVAPPAPTEPPPLSPLCVDPAPCGLAALWPFTCDCVQSPRSPPSEPRASVSISNQPLTLRERERKGWTLQFNILSIHSYVSNIKSKYNSS